jgi:uncharacterized membrane protein
LRRAALCCHAALVVAILGSAVRATSFGAAAATALAAAPLMATLPGLLAGRRRAASWTALLTVIYAAAATVEIVARAGAAPFATGALLAALGELGLLFALSRRPQADRE